jgi:hypothetical protein
MTICAVRSAGSRNGSPASRHRIFGGGMGSGSRGCGFQRSGIACKGALTVSGSAGAGSGLGCTRSRASSTTFSPCFSSRRRMPTHSVGVSRDHQRALPLPSNTCKFSLETSTVASRASSANRRPAKIASFSSVRGSRERLVVASVPSPASVAPSRYSAFHSPRHHSAIAGFSPRHSTSSRHSSASGAILRSVSVSAPSSGLTACRRVSVSPPSCAVGGVPCEL